MLITFTSITVLVPYVVRLTYAGFLDLFLQWIGTHTSFCSTKWNFLSEGEHFQPIIGLTLLCHRHLFCSEIVLQHRNDDDMMWSSSLSGIQFGRFIFKRCSHNITTFYVTYLYNRLLVVPIAIRVTISNSTYYIAIQAKQGNFFMAKRSWTAIRNRKQAAFTPFHLKTFFPFLLILVLSSHPFPEFYFLSKSHTQRLHQ